jgi:hypothetical protein
MRSAENLSAKRLNIISRAVADALMGVKWIRHGAHWAPEVSICKMWAGNTDVKKPHPH